MDLCEGRPFMIVISGILKCGERESETEKLFEELLENLKKTCKLKFEDHTGVLLEVEYSVVSISSDGFLLVGQNQHGIPFIFVVQDLMYPFYRIEIVGEDVKKAVSYIKKLLKDAIPEKFTELCDVRVLNVRYLDAPLSLDVIGLIPDR